MSNPVIREGIKRANIAHFGAAHKSLKIWIQSLSVTVRSQMLMSDSFLELGRRPERPFTPVILEGQRKEPYDKE
jgi:hypothetical protein